MMASSGTEEKALEMAESGGNYPSAIPDDAHPENGEGPARLSIDSGVAEFANMDDDAPPAETPAEPVAVDVMGGDTEHSMLTSPAAVNRALRKKCYVIIALLVVVAGLIALIVGLVVSNNNKSSGSEEAANEAANEGAFGDDLQMGEGQGPVPTTSPISAEEVDENALRLQQTLDFLTTFDVSDPATLYNPETLKPETETPQYQAAVWISQNDQHRLSIPTSDNAVGYMFKQRYSLAVFWFAMGGSEWEWGMNWMSPSHECEWYSTLAMQAWVWWGVHCDGEPDLEDGNTDLWSKTRTVTDLGLPPENNMKGSFPPELQHLRYLKSLYLEQNEGVAGPIPDQYGSFEHLSDLALVYTSLDGKIPRTFAKLKKLQYLILENNKFSGDTLEGDLDFLKEMTTLSYISLDYNAEITGTLPDLSSLSKLEVLAVPNTGLSGPLPQSLSQLKELRLLFLDDNAFTGSTDMIQSMPNLTHVYLEDNQFDGTIDDTFFADLKNLVHLDVSNCSFSGKVPGHLFNLPSLQVLDMSLNNLDGQLPAEALSNVNASNLQFLSLHTNKISGPIPSSIKNLENLATLDLSLNQFSGVMPKEIGGLKFVNILFLGRNSFTPGPAPAWLRNMTQLTELSLKRASLTETIPKWLGELTNLLYLDLGENDLTGEIPQTLNSLADIMVLILNKNLLTGQLGLGQLSYLEVLLIDDNSLTGNTDEICVHEFIHFVSDCATTGEGDIFDQRELTCSCCTLCCNDANVTCNDDEWLGNHEGIWEFGYERVRWDFGGSNPIFPWIDYNYLQSQEDGPGGRVRRALSST